MNIHFVMIPPVRASFLYPSEDIRILYAAFFSKLCLVSHDNSLITFFSSSCAIFSTLIWLLSIIAIVIEKNEICTLLVDSTANIPQAKKKTLNIIRNIQCFLDIYSVRPHWFPFLRFTFVCPLYAQPEHFVAHVIFPSKGNVNTYRKPKAHARKNEENVKTFAQLHMEKETHYVSQISDAQAFQQIYYIFI